MKDKGKKQVVINYIDRVKFSSTNEIRRILIAGGLDVNRPVMTEKRLDTLDLVFTGEPIEGE